MAKLQITYRKSTIGFSKDQKTTIRSLGLRKLNSVVLQEDTPSIRGMIFKVQHLVNVEEVADDTVLAKHADKPTTTIVRTASDAVPMKARSTPVVTPAPVAGAPASEAVPVAPRRARKSAAAESNVEPVAAAVEAEAVEPVVVETVETEAESVEPATVETVETAAEPTVQMNVASAVETEPEAEQDDSSDDAR